MKKVLIVIFSLVIFVLVSFIYLRSGEPQSSESTLGIIGIPAITPATIIASRPTQVTVTIPITDPNLILTSVNLQRLDATGRVAAVVGNLNDGGFDGDEVAGDKIFTLQAPLNEPSAGEVGFQVSVEFRGLLRRSFSGVAILRVEPPLDQWRTFAHPSFRYEIKYPSNWSFALGEASSVGFSPLDKQPDPSLEFTGDIIVEVFANPRGLTFSEFYQWEAEVDLFQNSMEQMPFRVNGLEAVKFIGVPGMLGPSTIVSVNKGGFVVEINDVNEEHQQNGVFDSMISSFR
jgi:hypothetical protein